MTQLGRKTPWKAPVSKHRPAGLKRGRHIRYYAALLAQVQAQQDAAARRAEELARRQRKQQAAQAAIMTKTWDT